MGIVYLLWLGYLFVGIAIISDIFMESIDEITAQTIKVDYWDKDKTQHVTVEKHVWNETVANLTLMALGSSAPEILLSVISSVKDITAVPPEIGPSTIVGSAAFNLLVISGVSIIAVGGEDNAVKQIDDMWVFAVTSLFSLWAYIWLWICVDDGYVSATEGILTCVFFVLLIVIAYTADRINDYRTSQRMSQEDQIEKVRQEEQKMKKDRLRSLAREYSDNAVVEAA
jgi:solute carrier family 8 (sodium/calcium exchanger)